jgi:nicotinamide-nucleotide amidase
LAVVVSLDPFIEHEAAVLRLADVLRAAGLRIATAESCTGGLIAAACTSVAGSSDWFDRAFITYSNEAKTEMLGVPDYVIAVQGAVSESVAKAMAEGALSRSNAQMAISATGIAGPGGGTPTKPVGTVWLALARSGVPTQAWRLSLPGDRAAVRSATVGHALGRLLRAAQRPP